MENQENSLKALFEKSYEYLETRIDLVRLKTIDKCSDVLSSTASSIAIMLGILAFLGMLSIGLALFIGQFLGRLYYGFFIMAGFYCLIVLILYVLRHRWIKTPVYNEIIKKMSTESA